MAKSTYRLHTLTSWQAMSGNGILAIANKLGSNKKITIKSVEIYNNTTLGKHTGLTTSGSMANLYGPQRYSIARVAALGEGGDTVYPSKMDSNAADWPSNVTIKTFQSYTPNYKNFFGSLTYTDATVAIGDTTFTPGTAPDSAAWLASRTQKLNAYLKVDSGNNIGVFQIQHNTTTALTLARPLYQAGSTTGYIAVIDDICHRPFVKMLAVSQPYCFNSSYGLIGTYKQNGGTVFTSGANSNQQAIYISAGEKLAVFAQSIDMPFPCQVEATLTIEGTPNRTYNVSFTTYTPAEGVSILSIDNPSGSGYTIRLDDLTLSELGTADTPYFQLVPLDSVHPDSYNAASTKLTSKAIKMDSNAADLSSTVCEIFTNVPVLPKGVPQSFVSEGSSITTKGFNYLNTKDFLGPVYATFFPEAASNYYSVNTDYYTVAGSTPGNFGAQMSQKFSNIAPFFPIVVREGEVVGIVSGAELATAATPVAISGWLGLEFSILFEVDTAIVPSITFTGLKAGSEVRAYVGTDPATAVEIGGIESSTTSFYFEHDNANQAGFITIFHIDYLPIRLNFSNSGTDPLGNYQGAVVSIPIQQTTERNYYNP